MIDAFHRRDFLKGYSGYGCNWNQIHGRNSYKRAFRLKQIPGLFPDSVWKQLPGFIKSYHTILYQV
jgi:hypothetical protein